jgi:hypothetical protein
MKIASRQREQQIIPVSACMMLRHRNGVLSLVFATFLLGFKISSDALRTRKTVRPLTTPSVPNLGLASSRKAEKGANAVSILSRGGGSTGDDGVSTAKTLKSTKTSPEHSLTVEKHAIVTLANSNYERCGIKLVQDIRESGKWTGDIVFMASYSIDPKARDWLLAQHVTIFYTDTSSQEPHYLKYEIFTKTFFRQFSKIMYLDSDTTVALPISPFFSLNLPPDVWIAMRDNGPGIGKGSLHKNEFATHLNIPDKRNPGASCAFVLDMHLIPSPRFLDSLLQTLTTVLKSKMWLHDQPILHILFLEHYAVFAPCMPLNIVGSNEVVEGLWTRKYCDNKTEIFVHDYKKTCMKDPHNLFIESHKAHGFHH